MVTVTGHADPVLTPSPGTISITVDVTPDAAADARDMGRDVREYAPPLWPTATRRRRGPSSASR